LVQSFGAAKPLEHVDRPYLSLPHNSYTQ
jgi:hypothetical protein